MVPMLIYVMGKPVPYAGFVTIKGSPRINSSLYHATNIACKQLSALGGVSVLK